MGQHQNLLHAYDPLIERYNDTDDGIDVIRMNNRIVIDSGASDVVDIFVDSRGRDFAADLPGIAAAFKDILSRQGTMRRLNTIRTVASVIAGVMVVAFVMATSYYNSLATNASHLKVYDVIMQSPDDALPLMYAFSSFAVAAFVVVFAMTYKLSKSKLTPLVAKCISFEDGAYAESGDWFDVGGKRAKDNAKVISIRRSRASCYLSLISNVLYGEWQKAQGGIENVMRMSASEVADTLVKEIGASDEQSDEKSDERSDKRSDKKSDTEDGNDDSGANSSPETEAGAANDVTKSVSENDSE